MSYEPYGSSGKADISLKGKITLATKTVVKTVTNTVSYAAQAAARAKAAAGEAAKKKAANTPYNPVRTTGCISSD